MQQELTPQEEKYADGLGEYASFYGGPSYTYLPSSSRLEPEIIHELPGSPASQPAADRRESALSDHRRSLSYDLAANDPEIRRQAEGPQLVYQQSNYGPAETFSGRQGYTKAHSHPLEQHLPPAYSPSVLSDDMYAPRYQRAHVSYSVPSPVPAPLSPKKYPHMDPYIQQFPHPPTSPTSPSLPSSPDSPSTQSHIHPAFRQPVTEKKLPEIPSVPQPLVFQRATPLLPTPPQSNATDTYGDGLRDQMQALSFGDSSSGRYASARPRYLSRMDTMRSASSRSSNTPLSPFDQNHRISVTEPGAAPGSFPQGPPELSAKEAHAQVLRLLDKADETSSRRSSGIGKTGFSLRRSNTSRTASNASHSQDTLTDVLEKVAEEGSLPLVKAAIGLGADPIYRSTAKLKKVKHEALAKATASGHAKVVNYLLEKGASYGEPQKKSMYTPTDRALLTAVYKGHAELASVLITSHGANPMIEQWPREMEDTQHYWDQKQLRLSKRSVIDGISHWKNEDEGLYVLDSIIQSPKFDPTAAVSGVFDNKSELQSAESGSRPWNTTYEYSALACFVRAGWADAVEHMLSMKGSPNDYEKEDDVLQYQDKVTRFISPVNALTKDTWDQRSEDALRILRLLIDRGFNIGLAQRTANDLGPRSVLGRALGANASQAVEMIIQSRPELVKEVISFRRNKKETKAQPLAAAIALERLDTARILLRGGAHPRDPAFDMNVLQFAAHQGGETGTAMLAEMIPLAPELTYAALDIAIRRTNSDCVRVLLDSISAAASRNEIAALPAIWDMLLPLPAPDTPETQTKYLDLIDMIDTWDNGHALPRPHLPAILAAIKRDNYVGMERMLQLGIVDGQSLVLNCKAQPLGEQGMWTVLECAEGSGRSAEWLGLLRGWGAPLFT